MRIPEQFPIVEGTPAFQAWERHLKENGTLKSWQRLAVFEIVLADGKKARGTLKPSLFPPASPRDGPS